MNLAHEPDPENSASAKSVAEACGGAQRSGDGWKCRCPAHEDKTPSLSVTQRAGKLLFKCHAGCEQGAVLDALQRLGALSPSRKQSVSARPEGIPKAWPPASRQGQPAEGNQAPYVRHWSYKNEAGETVGIVARYEAEAGEKQIIPFFQKFSRGSWKAGGAPKQKPLYNLDRLAAAQEVWLVEGEKCAEELTKAGHIATTWLGGALAVGKADFSPLAGKRVVLWPDNDEPGFEAMRKAKSKLLALAPRPHLREIDVKALHLAPGEDCYDYVQQQGAEALQRLPFVPTGLKIVNAGDWLSEAAAEPDQVLLDTFDSGDKVCIVGSSKARKSFFALQLALSLATGQDFLTFRTAKARKVLLAQFELKESHYHRRVNSLAAAMRLRENAVRDSLFLTNLRGNVPSLDSLAEAVKELGIQVLICDPLYKLIPDGDENKTETLKPVLLQFDRLAEETGATVVYVAHGAKGSIGERDIRDRVSGSGVVARDYDCCISLCSHAEDPLNSVVVGTLLRNYPPREPFTAEWRDGRFQESAKLPIEETSTSRRSKRGFPMEELKREALTLLNEPQPIECFLEGIKQRCRVGEKKARVIYNGLYDEGRIKIAPKSTRKGRRCNLVGLPEGIEALLARDEDCDA